MTGEDGPPTAGEGLERRLRKDVRSGTNPQGTGPPPPEQSRSPVEGAAGTGQASSALCGARGVLSTLGEWQRRRGQRGGPSRG